MLLYVKVRGITWNYVEVGSKVEVQYKSGSTKEICGST